MVYRGAFDMSYSKTLSFYFRWVFCFFPFLVFGDFTTNDRETLDTIYWDVKGISDTTLPGVADNAYQAKIHSNDARLYAQEASANTAETKTMVDNVYYQTEEILNAIESLSLDSGSSCPWSSSDVNDLLADVGYIEYDVGEIRDDVGDIFARIKLIESDTGDIVSSTDKIASHLQNVPAFITATTETQNQILQILNSLKLGIVGDTVRSPAIYDLVQAITNKTTSSGWGQDDVEQLLTDVGYIKTDVSSINTKVGSIFESLALMGVDLASIKDGTIDINTKLANLPTFIESSTQTQNDIKDILTSLQSGILGDTPNESSLYDLIKSITNRVANSSYNRTDLQIIENSLSSILLESQNFYKATYGNKSVVETPLYDIVNNFYQDLHAVTNSILSTSLSVLDIFKDLRAITNSIVEMSDDLYLLADAVQVGKEEGTSYILVSNLAQNVTSPIDLSIITNAILGSAFVSPFSADYNSYYDLLEDYKNGEIDSQTFIAEMGLYNWFAGLNFGDWYVTIPDDEDPENMQRWGIIDQAKLLWSPLAESTAFPPYETSDARYFLYGTRDLTDNSTNLAVIAENTSSNLVLALKSLNYAITNYNLTHTIALNTHQLHNISEHIGIIKDDLTKLVTMIEEKYNALDSWDESDVDTPTDYEELDEPPDDIIPESNEQLTGVSDILNVDVENDTFTTSFENFVHDIENKFDPFQGSAENIQLTFNAGLLGGSKSVTVEIQHLPRAKAMISSVTEYVLSGWKIACMIFVVSASAKTLMSEGRYIEGLCD